MPDFALGYLIIIIVFAVGFGLVNGFNDAANAIAAAIGTRSLSPRNAVIMAAILNCVGAATGYLLGAAHKCDPQLCQRAGCCRVSHGGPGSYTVGCHG
jgi:hypothetical protein